MKGLVGQDRGVVRVMSHDERAKLDRLLETQKLTPEAVLQTRVERGKRFVEEQQRRRLERLRADRDNAIAVLLKHIKFQPKYGDMAYREVIDGYNERGELPARSMSVYWKILLEGGTVKSVMPDERLIDDRFIKSFAEWSA